MCDISRKTQAKYNVANVQHKLHDLKLFLITLKKLSCIYLAYHPQCESAKIVISPGNDPSWPDHLCRHCLSAGRQQTLAILILYHQTPVKDSKAL